MKRGRKDSPDAVLATRDFVKSTYLLDPILKANLQYVALSQQKEQSDLVREALTAFIKKQGLDPARLPQFVFEN